MREVVGDESGQLVYSDGLFLLGQTVIKMFEIVFLNFSVVLKYVENFLEKFVELVVLHSFLFRVYYVNQLFNNFPLLPHHHVIQVKEPSQTQTVRPLIEKSDYFT